MSTKKIVLIAIAFVLIVTIGIASEYDSMLAIIFTIIFTLMFFVAYPLYFFLKSRNAPRIDGIIIERQDAWLPGMKTLVIKCEFADNTFFISRTVNEEDAEHEGERVPVVVNCNALEKSHVGENNAWWVNVMVGVILIGICLYRMYNSA